MQNLPPHTNQRERNLALFLRHLREQAPLSRAQIAELTNLNRSTISSLTDELEELSLIHEIGLENPNSGRPGRLLQLNPTAGTIIGCELGLTHIRVALTNFGGNIHWQQTVPLDVSAPQDDIITATASLIQKAITHNSTHNHGRLFGIGLTLAGWLDREQEILLSSPNLQWQNVPIGRLLRAHLNLNLPLYIDNDANAAALGAHFFGQAKGKRNFLFLRAGVGVGGGLFLNGELYRGTAGLAGEIGHITLNHNSNRPCRCGKRGCWETEINTAAVLNRVRQHLEIGRTSTLHNQPLTLPHIITAADSGDLVAIEALAETGTMLGLGLGNLINIFNPDLIVLGGALSAAYPHLAPTLQDCLTHTALPNTAEMVTIVPSTFGPDALVIGAAALVVDAVLLWPKQIAEVKG